MDGFSVAGNDGDGELPAEFLVKSARNTVKGPLQLIDFGA